MKDENGNQTQVKFQYHEPFYFYHKFRGAIDNHNNKRHQPIPLEKTWATKTWAHCVFVFVLAVCKVNTYLIDFHMFAFSDKLVMLQYCKKPVKALIYNTYDSNQTTRAVSAAREQERVIHSIVARQLQISR